jgi:hypothetical protein
MAAERSSEVREMVTSLNVGPWNGDENLSSKKYNFSNIFCMQSLNNNIAAM